MVTIERLEFEIYSEAAHSLLKESKAYLLKSFAFSHEIIIKNINSEIVWNNKCNPWLGHPSS